MGRVQGVQLIISVTKHNTKLSGKKASPLP